VNSFFFLPRQQDKNPKYQSLMVQKLSKTLYQKVLMEHQRYARVKGLNVPEEKDLLHQQIVGSPELNKYINRGMAKKVENRKSITRLRA
jgi:hypothetical protein